MPLNMFSVAARLPQGEVFGAIKRIRQTINEYTRRDAMQHWVIGLKLGAIKALSRRLRGHQDSILGKSHVDLEIAYRQLRARVSSLTSLLKAIKSWCNNERDDLLEGIAKYKPALLQYLEFMELDFFHDIKIVFMCGAYKDAIREGLPIHEAMHAIDMEDLAACQAAMMSVPPLVEEVLAKISAESSREASSAQSGMAKQTTKKDKYNECDGVYMDPWIPPPPQCHTPHIIHLSWAIGMGFRIIVIFSGSFCRLERIQKTEHALVGQGRRHIRAQLLS